MLGLRAGYRYRSVLNHCSQSPLLHATLGDRMASGAPGSPGAISRLHSLQAEGLPVERHPVLHSLQTESLPFERHPGLLLNPLFRNFRRRCCSGILWILCANSKVRFQVIANFLLLLLFCSGILLILLFCTSQTSRRSYSWRRCHRAQRGACSFV